MNYVCPIRISSPRGALPPSCFESIVEPVRHIKCGGAGYLSRKKHTQSDGAASQDADLFAFQVAGKLHGVVADGQWLHERSLIRSQSLGAIATILGHNHEIAQAPVQLARATQKPHCAARVVIAGPALIASAAGDGWIHDYHISGLETCYLPSHILHDCTTLMTNTKGETHDLVSDPSLSVIVEIGSRRYLPGRS